MEDMNKPAASASQMGMPAKKAKSNYMMPIMIAFAAVAGFLLVWYFAVK